MFAQKYLGKVCPYCKTSFTQYDDIVLCDRCGMPHHRDCWIENHGCTTFGCDGTVFSPANELPNNNSHVGNTDDFEIELSLGGPGSDLASSYCLKCGSVREPGDTFCRHCGNHHTPEISATPQTGNDIRQSSQVYNSTTVYDDRQILEGKFVGQNTEYYLLLFRKFREQNKSTSWNWAAFIFLPYWFLYRKMYGIGIGVFAAVLLLNLLGYFGIFLLLSGHIIFGVFANHIYYKQIMKKADVYVNLKEPYAAEYMKKNSGTSSISVVTVVILYMVIMMLTKL